MRKWLTVALVAALVFAFAAPAMAKTVNPPRRPVLVSHPYIAKYKHKVGKDFKTWGYIKPRLASGAEATVTIVSQRWNGKHSWVASSGLDAKTTLSSSGKFRHVTNYKATLNVSRKGFYRMRAVLVWMDSKGIQHMKKSSWKYYRIVR